MRPGQNKRMRGRNNNNRKGPNPLTRSYESNGPDVKVRGTAQHIAEKYLQLARDAQSSGDPVMAESYLQHAEHYFRLIAAAMQAQQQQQVGYNRPPGEVAESEDDDDDDGDMPDRFASPFERNQPNMNPPQPNFAPQPQPFADRHPSMDRPQNQDRGPRPDRQDRQDRQDRPQHQQRDYRDHRPQRDRNFQPRPLPPPVVSETMPQDEPQPSQSLPAFITGGARPIAPDSPPLPSVAAQSGVAPSLEGEHENANFHLRNRRRRRPRPAGEGEQTGSERPFPDEVPAGE
jgi:hypothetical protein